MKINTAPIFTYTETLEKIFCWDNISLDIKGGKKKN